jgi:hypothetical protein
MARLLNFVKVGISLDAKDLAKKQMKWSDYSLDGGMVIGIKKPMPRWLKADIMKFAAENGRCPAGVNPEAIMVMWIWSEVLRDVVVLHTELDQLSVFVKRYPRCL